MNIFGQSFDEIRQEIENWIDSISEDSSWKDFVETGSGQTIIDLIASLAQFLQYNSAFARAEIYPNTAKLRTSLVNLACAFAYPVNRNSTAEIQVDFTANTDGLITRFDVVGSVGNQPVSLKEDLLIESGQSYTATFLVGQWYQESLTPKIEDFSSYLIEGNIDNNYIKLKVDNKEINFTKELEWLDQDTVGDITTPFGIAIWLGDGELGYKIESVNSEVVFEYFSPSEISDIADLTLDIGVINNSTLIKSYTKEDSIYKLARVISGYRAARRVAVTEEGHRYIAMSYPGIIDAYVYKDETADCCSVNIVYLKEDKSLFNTTEKLDFLDYIYKYALVGVTYIIEDPVANQVTFSMTIYIESTADTTTINSKIEDYFDGLSKVLANKIFISDILDYIKDLDGVTRCYIQSPVEDFTLANNEYLDYTLDISYKIDDGSLDKYGA